MACQCAPALVKLRDEVNKRWPNRDKASDGCCASAKHTTQNPTSDHEPYNGYAHAIDIDEDLSATEHTLGWLVPVLLADSRTRYVIYEARIYYPDGTAKAYTGTNPHDKHLHLSIKRTATFETRSWLVEKADAPLEPAPIPEEDDEKMLYLLKVEGDPKVWISDLLTRRHVTSDKQLADIRYHAGKRLANGGGVIEVKAADAAFVTDIPLAG